MRSRFLRPIRTLLRRLRQPALGGTTVGVLVVLSLAGAAPPDSEPAGWWPADSHALDLAGGHHGTVLPGVSFGPGQVGGAFVLDGRIGAGVMIGDQPAFESMAALTVEAWVCTTDSTGNVGIVTQHYAHQLGNTPSWVLRTYHPDDSGRVSFGVDTEQDQLIFDELISSMSIADGWFHYVVGTYDGSFARLYVDGVLQEQRPLAGTVADSTNEVVFGNFGSGNHTSKLPETYRGFDGRIDEVRIWRRALTEGEIVAEAEARLPRHRCDAAEVAIDIKPGSDPNSVRLTARGVIPVAVLGSADFDAASIDPASLRFGPGGATIAHRGHLEDVDGDGFIDLVGHFRVVESGLSRLQDSACLTGRLHDASAVEGCDSIRPR